MRILRIFLFFLLLELFLRIGAQVSVSIQDYENQKHLKHLKAIRILCLGDSLTYEGGENSYPSRLEKMLNQNNGGKVFEVINEGKPSSTSDTTFLMLKSKLEEYQPDIVITMIGMNDTKATLAVNGNGLEPIKLFLSDVRLVRVFHFLWGHFQEAVLRIEKNFLSGSLYKEEKKIDQPEKFSQNLEVIPKPSEEQ